MDRKWSSWKGSDLDRQTGGRVIHALAALRDCCGDVAGAAAKLDISQEQLIAAIEEVGPNFYEMPGDGRVLPSRIGLRFADQVDVFPYVSW
jgi:hypothetical protein